MDASIYFNIFSKHENTIILKNHAIFFSFACIINNSFTMKNANPSLGNLYYLVLTNIRQDLGLNNNKRPW